MTLRISPAEIVRAAVESGNPGLLSKAPSWSRIPLGEVARVVNGAPYESRHFNVDGRGEPLIRIRDVTSGRVSTWYDGPWESLHRVESGAILIGMDGDFRATCWKAQPGLLNQRVCRIDVDESKYNKRFLLHAVQGYLDAIWRATSSITVKHLSSRSIQQIPLPCPPMHEQRRIVEILEEHLSRLDAADNLLRRANARGLALLRSTLTAGLRAKLLEDDHSEGDASDLVRQGISFVAGPEDRTWRVPPGWSWVRIGDVFEVNVGATPSRADKSMWQGDLAWVSSGEVAFGRITSTKETIDRTTAGRSLRRVHPPGTVMLAMIGEGKTRGQAAILDIEAAHNQNCASIRVSRTRILPEYVFGYLQERYFHTRRSGAGAQQPALNKSHVLNFAIPIPPLGTQRRLVVVWDQIRDEVRRTESAAQRALGRSAALRAAVLTAAFSGRLTAVSHFDRVLGTTETDQGAIAG